MKDEIKIRELIYEMHVVLRQQKNFLMIKLKRSRKTPLSTSEASGATGTTIP